MIVEAMIGRSMMNDENPSPPAAHSGHEEANPSRRAVLLIAVAALSVSLISFAYFYTNGMTNLYGDGVARLNIARKVVDHPDDSLWQRYIQIGTPWLPLQTVLMLPLVANDHLWRTGMAGSMISMLFYVIAAVSVFMIAASLYRNEAMPYSKALPLISAGIFLLNPPAIYMQTTPMTEPVFMGTLAAAVLMLQRWVEEMTRRRLLCAAIAMTIATLARYEAWPVAAASALLVALLFDGSRAERIRQMVLFSALAAIGPVYWLWHNWAIYGDALEFLTGPHSARGIYLQNRASLGWAKIFVGNLPLDVLLMAVTAGVCIGPLVLMLAATGLARLAAKRRRAFLAHSPVLLLLIPFFFHVFSVYRGEIQIFPLSAFGLLNVRYGLPHLLAAAVFAPACAPLLERLGRNAAIAIVCTIATFQFLLLISEGPSQLAVFQEGYRNGVNARPARELTRAAMYILKETPRPMILMHTGSLGPIVTNGGLRFSDIIHEGAIGWHRLDGGVPSDVSTIIIREGDPLDQRVRESPSLGRELTERFHEKVAIGRIRIFERN